MEMRMCTTICNRTLRKEDGVLILNHYKRSSLRNRKGKKKNPKFYQNSCVGNFTE